MDADCKLRVTVQQNGIIKPNAPHIVIIDVVRTAGTGFVSVSVGGAAQSVTASATLSFTASTGSDFKLIFSTNFVGYVNSVSVRGLTAITYNYLNLPEMVSNAKNHQMQYIYDASGRKLHQLVTEVTTSKRTDYNGEYIYQNDTLQFINHEEGRVVMKTATPEYQYHLKDHLGNVRMTFTATPETEHNRATLEADSIASEQGKFLRINSAKRVSAAIFDHTNGTSTGYAERLNGSANEKFGVAKSLSVMPGDVIQLEVYAKYVDTNTNNWTGALTTLMNQVAAGTSGVVIDGATYGTSTSSFPFAGAMTTSPESGAPKAYLNWLIFDRNYVLKDFGYKGITTAAKEQGQDVSHERLAPAQDITIKEAGYVYVYVSNEETTPVEVYFDDLKVTFTKSPVVQQDDYYPFGLTFNSYSRENGVANQYLFNGKELQDELGLGWLDYGARMYMPEIGRWGAQDAKAEKFISSSPYHFAGNNPILFYDIDGNEFTESALNRVKQLTAEIDKGVGKKTSKVAEAKEKLASGKLSENKAARQIARAERAIAQLESVRGELAQMAASDQVYNVRESSTMDFESRSGGKTVFNFSTNQVDLHFSKDATLADVAHEFKHGHQFESGELDLTARSGGIAHDKTDEVAAYDRGGMFGTSLYGKHNLPSDQSALPEGPVSIHSKHNTVEGMTKAYKNKNTSDVAFRINQKTHVYRGKK